MNAFDMVDYMSFVFTSDFRRNFFRHYVNVYQNYGPRFKRFNSAIDSLIGFYKSIEISYSILPDIKPVDMQLIRDAVSISVNELEHWRDNVPREIYNLFGCPDART